MQRTAFRLLATVVVLAGAGAVAFALTRPAGVKQTVVSGRVVAAIPDTKLYLYRGAVEVDAYSGLPETDRVAHSDLLPDGTFELRADDGDLEAGGGYQRGTVIAWSWQEAGLFSRGYCTRAVIEVRRTGTHDAERWVGRNGLPIRLTLTVPFDEAHACYTPALP